MNPDKSFERSQSQRWLWIAAFALFIAASVFAIHRGTKYAYTWDFIPPYSGARCFVHGADPYSIANLQREFTAAHGNLAMLDARHSWDVLLPLYPPSTFLLIAPITAFDYPVASAVWYYSGATLFCLAVALLAGFVERDGRWLYFLLAAMMMFSAGTDLLLAPGQVSTFAIALTAMAVWAFYRTRWTWLGVALLALALALKPHMAAAVFLFLLLRPRFRKPALLGGAIAIVLLIAGAAWLQIATGSSAWFAHWHTAVTSGIQPGGPNGPNLDAEHILNLQAIWSVWIASPRIYDLLSLLTAAAIGVLWVGSFWKARGEERYDLAAMAGLLCLSLLPVYHRDYDNRLLILTIPPLVWLLRRHLWAGLAMLVLGIPDIFSQTTLHTLRYLNVHNHADIATFTPMETLVYLRQQSGGLLLLAIAWPIVYYRYFRKGVVAKN